MVALEEVTKLAKRSLFEFLGGAEHAVGPRIGRLAVNGRKDVQTPNFLALTSRGAVPHLTPDVITSTTEFPGVYTALEDCKIHVHLI